VGLLQALRTANRPGSQRSGISKDARKTTTSGHGGGHREPGRFAIRSRAGCSRVHCVAGWAGGRSALVRACPSRMTDNTTIAALHQEKMRLLGNGSLTAGEGFGGVRPSSGAATTEKSGAPDSITSPSLSNIAAPGDGRTPKTSPPPSLTHYPSGGGGGGATHRQSSGLFIPLPPCRSTCV
jgi:hypothetical protein